MYELFITRILHMGQVGFWQGDR